MPMMSPMSSQPTPKTSNSLRAAETDAKAIALLARQYGVTKPMHTLRKSLESDWLAKYPIADVAAWLGNSPTVAMKHYHQTVGETMRSVTGKNPSPTQTENSSMS